MRRRDPLTAQPPLTSPDHYDQFLADLYDWMQGGWDAKAQANADLLSGVIAEHGLDPASNDLVAVDLGAGTGYQTVPLSQLGFEVVAIDSSSRMLAQIRDRLTDTRAKPVKLVVGDLLNFVDHLDGSADLVVCMTDTLSHLSSRAVVENLVRLVAQKLSLGGVFVISYRDLTNLPQGDGRFLPVRSDRERTLTCFLEAVSEDHVRVHDLLHTTNPETGAMDQTVSSYLKLRIPETWLLSQLEAAGLKIAARSEEFGLITLVVLRA